MSADKHVDYIYNKEKKMHRDMYLDVSTTEETPDFAALDPVSALAEENS